MKVGDERSRILGLYAATPLRRQKTRKSKGRTAACLGRRDHRPENPESRKRLEVRQREGSENEEWDETCKLLVKIKFRTACNFDGDRAC